MDGVVVKRRHVVDVIDSFSPSNVLKHQLVHCESGKKEGGDVFVSWWRHSSNQREVCFYTDPDLEDALPKRNSYNLQLLNCST